MSTRVRHILAFVGVSALAGPAWWGALALLPWSRDLVQEPHLWGLLGRREVVVAFSLTTLLVAGLLRRPILSPSAALLPVSMLGLTLGGVAFLWVVWGLSGALGQGAGFSSPPDVWDLVELCIASPLLGLLYACLAAPVSIPVSCALVWLMRKVGGVRTETTPAHP